MKSTSDVMAAQGGRNSLPLCEAEVAGSACYPGQAAFCRCMGRIAEESIQQLIATVNIVDVVSSYFPLKRMGGGYKACCPFHAEKTPSFTVSATRNSFHCFGCGKGGGAIRFVMDYENLPFVEAVRKLAGKYGVHLIEEAGSAESEEKTALRVRLLALHRDVTQWWHSLLLRSPLAEDARAYLKKRGLGADVAKRWMMGYAPADAGYYRDWMKQAGYTEEVLVQGGIYSPRDEDDARRGGYPRFKHRVMFPIRNDHGDVIAFSGRILDVEASPAKYMNSPATPIFSKSETFFGLDKSKRAIHKESSAIICEGQIDMIVCYESGVENVVAPLGTAFTPDHTRLLKRHTDQVVLCFDADNAGYKAAQSCFTELSKDGIFVRVATLPKGDDPDSLIRRDGVEAFRSHISAAKDFCDWLIDLRQPLVAPDNLQQRMKLLSEVAGSIAKLRDRMAQDSAMHRAAMKLSAPVEELRRMVTAHAHTMLKNQQTLAEREANMAARRPEPEDEPEITVLDQPAVRQLLSWALSSPEAREWMQRQSPPPLWAGFIGGDLIDSALQAPLDVSRQESVAAWLATLPAATEILVTAVMHGNFPAGNAVEAERTAINLRLTALNRRLDALTVQQRRPGIAREEAMHIMAELNTLQKEKVDLQRRVRDIRDTR
jgi:DNA primase